MSLINEGFRSCHWFALKTICFHNVHIARGSFHGAVTLQFSSGIRMFLNSDTNVLMV
jgi:hypothetical protein